MSEMKWNLQLFANDGEGGEKTEEPTGKKLSEARKKGQVAQSMDLTSAVCLLTFFCILKVYIGSLGNGFLESFDLFYRHIEDVGREEFTLSIACSILGQAISKIITMLLPIMLIAVVVAFVTILAQVKWKVTRDPMQPKFSKLNPMSGMKRLFSKDKLVKLLVDVAKICVMSYVVYSYVANKWHLLLDAYDFSLAQVIELLGDVIINLGLRISFCFLIIGFADYFYQKWKFHKDMMMTKQEVKDEHKNAEGDPKVKGQQKARMRQAAQRRMMKQIPQADVVITNPTHLAVAIKYEKEKYDAPIVVAKGADHLAQRIKEIAKENQVEIVENKPLARMLYHNVDLGAQIPPELYQMVAEVLAYVYGLKGKL